MGRELLEKTILLFGPAHLKTDRPLSILAETLADHTCYTQAVPFLRLRAQLRQGALGPDHPETLWAQDMLDQTPAKIAYLAILATPNVPRLSLPATSAAVSGATPPAVSTATPPVVQVRFHSHPFACV